jgi:hypothetical protein
MRGYVNVPQSIYCKVCKECGARPKDDRHYQTMPGLIDIEDWNRHNTIPASSTDFNFNAMLAW